MTSDCSLCMAMVRALLLFMLIAEIALQLQASEGHDSQRQQEMTGLRCRRKGGVKSPSKRTEGHGDDSTVRFWHIKDKPCFYTYGQEKEVPPLTNQHLELSIISVVSLRKKEKNVLELILIKSFANLYFFVSIVLENRTTVLESCRPRMNHV